MSYNRAGPKFHSKHKKNKNTLKKIKFIVILTNSDKILVFDVIHFMAKFIEFQMINIISPTFTILCSVVSFCS